MSDRQCHELFTAVATGPGQVDNLVFKSKGKNVATVARIYMNNGGPIEVNENNLSWFDACLPHTSEVECLIPMRACVFLPKDYRVFIVLADAVASGWTCNGVDLKPTVLKRFSNITCATCGSPAYVGFNQVECHNSSCRNYRP